MTEPLVVELENALDSINYVLLVLHTNRIRFQVVTYLNYSNFQLAFQVVTYLEFSINYVNYSVCVDWKYCHYRLYFQVVMLGNL